MNLPDRTQRVEALFTRHSHEVLGYLARRSGADEAADLMADVFEVVWRRRHQLPPDGEDKLWMFGIARHLLLNHHRGRRRQRRRETDQLATTIVQARHVPTPAEQDLLAALDRLDPQDREIITLNYWEGFTLAEIARLTNRPAPTVRTRLRRARLQLRTLLHDDRDDPDTPVRASAAAGIFT